jgi:hypothetical protein
MSNKQQAEPDFQSLQGSQEGEMGEIGREKGRDRYETCTYMYLNECMN